MLTVHLIELSYYRQSQTTKLRVSVLDPIDKYNALFYDENPEYVKGWANHALILCTVQRIVTKRRCAPKRRLKIK